MRTSVTTWILCACLSSIAGSSARAQPVVEPSKPAVESTSVPPSDPSAFEGGGETGGQGDAVHDEPRTSAEPKTQNGADGPEPERETSDTTDRDEDAETFVFDADDTDRRDRSEDPSQHGETPTSDAASEDLPTTPDADDAERSGIEDFSRARWGFDRAEEEQPWTLDDEQLRASGWEFRDQSFRRGSPLAGFTALTAGIPFHGVGHLMVGDSDAMFRLLISEVVALGTTGIGTLMRNAATRRNGVWATGAALQVTGLSVFAAGWLVDVVGSFKGTTVPLPTNTIDFKGLAADVHYTVLFSDEVDVSSVGVIGLQWGNERVFIRPEFSFGPADGYYRARMFVEYRHPLKLGDNTYMTVWAEAGEELVTSQGWGREILLGGIGLSVDMGDILEHTRGLVWKLRVGSGVQSFHYASQNHRLFLRRNIRVMLPVETSMAMNLNRGLNVEIGYRHRPDELVGALSRFGGALYQQFTVLPIDRLGISIRLEEGAYFRLWAGVRYFFKAPEL